MSISDMQGNEVIECQEFPAVFTAHWPSGGVDCCVKHAEAIHKLVALLHLAFTPMQVETIEWWLYENVTKVIYETEPNKIDHIVETPEQLWDYLNLPNEYPEVKK